MGKPYELLTRKALEKGDLVFYISPLGTNVAKVYHDDPQFGSENNFDIKIGRLGQRKPEKVSGTVNSDEVIILLKKDGRVLLGKNFYEKIETDSKSNE